VVLVLVLFFPLPLLAMIVDRHRRRFYCFLLFLRSMQLGL
jgi:hypothetical protein